MESFVDLKIRLFIGSISVIVVGFLIYFAQNPILQWVIACSVALLGITALWEYINLLCNGQNNQKIENRYTKQLTNCKNK